MNCVRVLSLLAWSEPGAVAVDDPKVKMRTLN